VTGNPPSVSSTSLGKSIAVLPFDNLSEEKANAYFSAGIQDEILAKLAGIGELKVISRKSTAKYKSAPEDLKTVARELGVATVLEGSVQKAGDKVRINVQLLDARIDTHLWAKSYDRDLKDVFAVERCCLPRVRSAVASLLLLFRDAPPHFTDRARMRIAGQRLIPPQCHWRFLVALQFL